MSKFGLGNKKSVVAFGISAYQMQIPTRIIAVANGSATLTGALQGLWTDVQKNPMVLAPAAVGYWLWGKPYRGKL